MVAPLDYLISLLDSMNGDADNMTQLDLSMGPDKSEANDDRQVHTH